MKSKLTLSIHKETIAKAKELARNRNSTVSQMVEEFIERTSRIIDADLAAKKDDQYSNEIHKKHGWQ